jgi:hypothetical protein
MTPIPDITATEGYRICEHANEREALGYFEGTILLCSAGYPYGNQRGEVCGEWMNGKALPICKTRGLIEIAKNPEAPPATPESRKILGPLLDTFG